MRGLLAAAVFTFGVFDVFVALSLLLSGAWASALVTAMIGACTFWFAFYLRAWARSPQRVRH